MGVSMSCLDPNDPAPAAVAAKQMVGSFTDADAIKKFVRNEVIDVLTVEIEHINVDALEEVQNELGTDIQPTPSTLRIIQDKYTQKCFFRDNDIDVIDFMDVPDQVCTAHTSSRKPTTSECIRGALSFSEGTLGAHSLPESPEMCASAQEASLKPPEQLAACMQAAGAAAGNVFGFPYMLKTKRLAYDGRGNAVVASPGDLDSAAEQLGGFEAGLYAEKWAPFEKELAIMVARFDPADSTHVHALPLAHKHVNAHRATHSLPATRMHA
jgi:phosphoribosylaminoimidazole carboxylase